MLKVGDLHRASELGDCVRYRGGRPLVIVILESSGSIALGAV